MRTDKVFILPTPHSIRRIISPCVPELESILKVALEHESSSLAHDKSTIPDKDENRKTDEHDPKQT